jgi:hypothetical protein
LDCRRELPHYVVGRDHVARQHCGHQLRPRGDRPRHAKPDGDRLPFIFKDAEGTGIHTTFAYDRANDSWSWTIDNVDKFGKASSFANVTLTRKQ